MKSIMMRLGAAALLGVSAVAAIGGPVIADDVKITILGVGDIYDFEGAGPRGGFARLNAVAKAEKAAADEMMRRAHTLGGRPSAQPGVPTN